MAKESLSKNDPGRAAKFLQLIDNENNKIKTHVEKVLELASLESARYNLQKSKASLHQIIREVAASFAPEVEGRHGSLSLRLLAESDIASVDVEHLKNVLGNLLDNSLKYSPGRPVIEISTEKNGNRLLIAVSDKGQGIDPIYKKKVFDKFFRVPSGEMQVKGFGLGLSYVMQIAKAHGGTVRLESPDPRSGGVGTKFTIVLPT